MASDQAFEAEFQLHMATERVPVIEIKKVDELARQAKVKLEQFQQKEGEK